MFQDLVYGPHPCKTVYHKIAQDPTIPAYLKMYNKIIVKWGFLIYFHDIELLARLFILILVLNVNASILVHRDLSKKFQERTN